MVEVHPDRSESLNVVAPEPCTNNTPLPAAQTEIELRPHLLDQVRDSLRRRRYSLRTEKVYIHWIKRFILFHDKCHPMEMGGPEVTQFLSHLARRLNVAASTQNQALSALLYLYTQVPDVKLPWLDDVERAKRPARLPTVLTQAEVRLVLAQLDGARWLMASMMYGAGMRLMECLGLRVKDLVFERAQIIIRDGKWHKAEAERFQESRLVGSFAVRHGPECLD